MIKSIIFDFDGVLVDSEILVAKAFSRYMIESGYDFNQNEFSKFAGKKTFQVISDLSDKFSINDEEKFYNDIMNIASNIYSKELTTVKGAFEYVKNSKRKLFIGSNSFKSRILDGLEKVQLKKFFKEDQVFSFDMVQKPKPYPDIYLQAINQNNLKKEETVIIEDSSVGVQAGVAAGIKVIGLTAGGHWHEDRSEEELINSGAFTVIKEFKYLDSILGTM